jgi:hypothetical protein
MVLNFPISSILSSNTDSPGSLNDNMLLLVTILKDIGMSNGGISFLLILLLRGLSN